MAWGAGLLVTVFATAGVSRLTPAVASVERGTLAFDIVKRGAMTREVHAPGTLVPEHMRIIAAVTAGRVERLPVRPGDRVTPGTTIVELSNPDVQLQALQSEQTMSAATSALAELRSSLEQQRLSQESVIAALTTQEQAALRNVKVQEGLAQKGLASRNEIESAHDAATELRTRMSIERARLDQMSRAAAEQMRLDAEQVGRLRAIVQENRNRVVAMRALAGATGVVQTLGDPPLELGQWVPSGAELARVAEPGRLKAVLRVPEGQATDVGIGQRVSIDTRSGTVPGHVTRANPSSQAGTVTVEVALDGPLPAGTRSDLSVDGTIEIERLPDVLHVARPAYGAEGADVTLFRVEPNTGYARRVRVAFGKASSTTIEIRRGLAAGDSVVVSDVSVGDDVPRIRIR
jgi:HlyD family secretion protein